MPETKKQQLYDSDEEHYECEVAEKQLEHGQVYVQLLKDRAGDLQKKAIQVDVSYIEAAADVDQ